jgi:2-polyprenyl-3-methyl-5-hydroxy-6-metoxy-1,4-benzoquinol methylase
MLESSTFDKSPYGREDYRTRIYESYTRNFHDANGRFDRQTATRWGAAYAHYLRGWLPPKSAHIADLACGSGGLLFFLRERGYESLAGVDGSAEQVSLARQITDSVVQQDVLEYLANRRDSFDLITGLDIIEHLEKPRVLDFIDACFGALRPGGRLILQTPNADSPWGSMYRYADFTHEICFNPSSLTQLMTLSGFGNIESREMGPIMRGYSLASSLRGIVWQTIRLAFTVWNYAELGHAGSRVFTRVFLISGTKSPPAAVAKT